jgi:hypothetical protein
LVTHQGQTVHAKVAELIAPELVGG